MQLKDLCLEVDSFVRNRGWYGELSEKPQTPKNLAISLAVEAAELLELVQWTDYAGASELADELADVLIYTAQLANVANIDLELAVRRKLAENNGRIWPRAANAPGGA